MLAHWIPGFLRSQLGRTRVTMTRRALAYRALAYRAAPVSISIILVIALVQGPVLDAAPLPDNRIQSLSVESGADLAYLGKDASGQSVYATVSYTEGEMNYFTISPDGMQGAGFNVQYFEGKNLGKLIVAETRDSLNMPMGNGSPHKDVPRDDFSIRATGTLRVTRNGTYTFFTRSDDGVRLYINGRPVIDKWKPQGTTEYSGSVDLVAGRNYQIKLEYFEQGGPGHLELLWKKPGSDVASHVSRSGSLAPGSFLVRETEGLHSSWQAEYFEGRNFEKPALKRSENVIDHDFNRSSAAASVPRTNFSARWSGKLKISRPGLYRFYTTSDDGVRLYVNGQSVIDEWRGMAPTEHSGEIQLSNDADIVLEYFQGGGGASIRLEWEGPQSGRRLLGPAGGFRGLEIPSSVTFVHSLLSQNSDSTSSPIRFATMGGGIESTLMAYEVEASGLKPAPVQISGASDMSAAFTKLGLLVYDNGALIQYGEGGKQQELLSLNDAPLTICSDGSLVTSGSFYEPGANGQSFQEYPLAKFLAAREDDSNGDTAANAVVSAQCFSDQVLLLTEKELILIKRAGGLEAVRRIPNAEPMNGQWQGNRRGLQILKENPLIFAYGNGLYTWKGEAVDMLYRGTGELSCASGPIAVCLDSDAGKFIQFDL